MTDVVLKGLFLQSSRGVKIADGGGATWSFDPATNTLSVAIASGGVSGFDEAAQDAVFNAIADSTSIDVTYNDAGNAFSLVVLPGGVDHNSLLNFSANKHLDHTAVSLTAGAGLTGGGDISASRTFDIGAGTGITVNTDDIAINQAFTPTWTGLHTFTNSITANHIDIGEADTMVLNGGTIAAQLQINSDTLAIAEIHTHSSAGATFAPILYGARGRGTEALPVIVSNGDYLLRFVAVGYDGVDYAAGASIDFIVDATPGSNDMPTAIVFSTTPDGTQVPVEAMRIGSTKLVTFADGLTTAGVIDLGHASDTTIARVSAGVVSIEGNNIITTASYTASDVLSKLLTVDGASSGLDADLLDGISSAGFLQTSTYQALTPTWTQIHTFSATPVFNAGITVNAAARNVASLAQSAQSFGNTTDNPTFTFLGTGLTTHNGAVYVDRNTKNCFVLNSSGTNYGFIQNNGADSWALGTGTDIDTLGTAALTWTKALLLTFGGPAVTKGYTVSTLPAGTTGAIAHVTDALAPTYLATLVGGGAVKTLAFYNGANWVGA